MDEVKTSIKRDLILVKDTWYKYGVSIVSDGWSNVRENPLTNIIAVNSCSGMFLYAEDYSGVKKIGAKIVDFFTESN